MRSHETLKYKLWAKLTVLDVKACGRIQLKRDGTL